MMFLYTLLLIVIIFISALLYVKEKHKFAKNLKSPYAVPFFGVLFEVYGLDSKG